MKKILPVFFVTFLLFSCSTTEKQSLPEVVRYDGATISSVREFVQSIEVVKLDHQDSITIGGWNTIQQQDSSFYIGDRQGIGQIYRFNRQGHFLNSIGKTGRAPGEYQNLTDFYISDTANQIYIQSSPDFRLYLYNKQGDFIQQRHNPINAKSLTKKGDNFWWYAGHDNTQQVERVLYADSSLNMIRKFLPLETKIISVTGDPAFTSWKDNRYLIITMDPFIYKIDGDSLQSIVHFDFGKHNITDSFWKSENWMEAFTRLNNNGFFSFRNFFINDDYSITAFTFQMGDTELQSSFVYAIKNLKTNRWDWVCHKVNSPHDQMPNLKESGLDCFSRMKGFTQDGKLMLFLYAHELELLKAEDKALIQNPELLENTDPEMDMFILLCTMK